MTPNDKCAWCLYPINGVREFADGRYGNVVQVHAGDCKKQYAKWQKSQFRPMTRKERRELASVAS